MCSSDLAVFGELTTTQLKSASELERLTQAQEALLRTESKNLWEQQALTCKTQFNYVFPDGTVVRAGLDPRIAAVVSLRDVLRSGGGGELLDCPALASSFASEMRKIAPDEIKGTAFEKL